MLARVQRMRLYNTARRAIEPVVPI
ncbi:MAG: hypothetical protein RLZZ217_1710, partial [Planctomycetota bacterium]